MKIDKIKKKFFESYNESAMNSIDELSKEYGLVINNKGINLFNIRESFEKFNTYIEGYCEYIINNKDNENASSRETICESANKFIDEGIFTECLVLYKDTPEFVKTYIEESDHTIDNIDKIKTKLFEAAVDAEYIGDINNFCDLFVDKLNQNFTESMNKLLTASGYKYKNREKKIPEKKPEFL